MTLESRFTQTDDEAAHDIDRRLAQALDLYADDSGPPGLSAMAARARRGDTIVKALSGAAAAVLVFAAGWSSSGLLSGGTDPAPRNVAALMETERNWDLDPERVTFADLSEGAVSPMPLTELGLVLSSTQTRRAGTGAVQRMEYVTRQGQPVSIVLRRETRSEDSPLNIAAYRGRDVVHWTDGPLSIGVTGEVPRYELFDIAERVRAHLNAGQTRPIAPVAGGAPAFAAPALSTDSALSDPGGAGATVSTDTLPAAQSTTPEG